MKRLGGEEKGEEEKDEFRRNIVKAWGGMKREEKRGERGRVKEREKIERRRS